MPINSHLLFSFYLISNSHFGRFFVGMLMSFLFACSLHELFADVGTNAGDLIFDLNLRLGFDLINRYTRGGHRNWNIFDQFVGDFHRIFE